MAAPAKSLKGRWSQALAQFFGAVLFVLAIRWALFEPYVIPSGSMIPTLLIHDHIFVNKFAYGLRVPFAYTHLLRWASPRRGDIVVFVPLDDENIFFVKRVIGVAGDTIRIDAEGTLLINDKPVETRNLPEADVQKLLAPWPKEDAEEYRDGYLFRRETLGQEHPVVIESRDKTERVEGPFVVPQGEIFLMGDNRDNSHDSRRWGSLPVDRVLGRASVIWLSCEETLRENDRVCDPGTIRWNRVFAKVH